MLTSSPNDTLLITEIVEPNRANDLILTHEPKSVKLKTLQWDPILAYDRIEMAEPHVM
jgi:hypothetical protein